jgi:hypothetical protein
VEAGLKENIQYESMIKAGTQKYNNKLMLFITSTAVTNFGLSPSLSHPSIDYYFLFKEINCVNCNDTDNGKVRFAIAIDDGNEMKGIDDC